MNPQQALAFDGFVLDRAAGQLFGPIKAVPLTPKICSAPTMTWIANSAAAVPTSPSIP